MEELASGKGYADIAFIPRKGFDLPVMVVELKWTKDAATAIRQIKEKQYPDVLKNFGEDILLVGISYDKDDPEKKHTCEMELVQKNPG